MAGWEQIQWEIEFQQWLDELEKTRTGDLERSYGHINNPEVNREHQRRIPE